MLMAVVIGEIGPLTTPLIHGVLTLHKCACQRLLNWPPANYASNRSVSTACALSVGHASNGRRPGHRVRCFHPTIQIREEAA